MTAGRRAPQHDPTGERTADQSTQTAGGLHEDVDRVRQDNDVEGLRSGPGAEVIRDADDTAYRNDENLYETPRRYESDENDDERVMPSNDSSLKPKL